MQVVTDGNDIPWNNLIAGNGAPLAVSVNLGGGGNKSTFRSLACVRKGSEERDGEKRNSKSAKRQLHQNCHAQILSGCDYLDHVRLVAHFSNLRHVPHLLLDQRSFKGNQHGEGENAVIPVFIQAPQTHTEHLWGERDTEVILISLRKEKPSISRKGGFF